MIIISCNWKTNSFIRLSIKLFILIEKKLIINYKYYVIVFNYDIMDISIVIKYSKLCIKHNNHKNYHVISIKIDKYVFIRYL